ncbi:oxidoreductase [Nemania serpens]|nr:oxidoreductase [Nemania serpens]
MSPKSILVTNCSADGIDVTSSDSVAHAAQAAAASGRGLDILVNNAGARYAMPVLGTDTYKAQRLYDVSVWGSIRTVKAFADLLIASRGHIVNLSNMGAVTMRFELSLFGIIVATVMADAVGSRFHDNDAGCTAADFAESLVDSVILNGSAAVIYLGPYASSTKFVLKRAPRSLAASGSFYDTANQRQIGAVDCT